MTELETAWLAGIVEGEGCLQYTERKRKEKRSGTQYVSKEVSLTITMTDKDVVERCADLMGVPCREIKKHGANKKQPYRAAVTRWEKVEEVVRAIYPWLGARRREKADLLLEKCAVHKEWVVSGGRSAAWAANFAGGG